MLILSVLLAASLSQQKLDALDNHAFHVPGGYQVKVGWHDELNRTSKWMRLEGDNPAKVTAPVRGAMQLELGHRPSGWPHEYQWSGVAREARVDIARFPVLAARVREVQGYAHLDVEVLDAHGKARKAFRSSTVKGEGVCVYDFSKELDPAVYTLRLRLIVGGPNQGCKATYDWVRFTTQRDGWLLQRHPDWQRVTQAR